MDINIPNIKNWNGIGHPPASAIEQYFNLWHIELILRHFIYAALRLTFGNKWEKSLSEVKVGPKHEILLDLLKVRSDQTKKQSLYAKGYMPNIIWFSTTNELKEIILNKNNWGTCFKNHLNIRKKELIEALEPLSEQRNRWAHFRPLQPKNAKLESILKFLNKPLADWMADKYWNSNPIKKEDFDKFVGIYESKVPNGVPLMIDLYEITGFLDRTKPLDRGYKLLLEENKVENCYWAKLYNIGGTAIWSFDAAFDCAIKLGKKAIHVAINYDEFCSLDKAKKQGVEDISISFSKKDGLDNLIESLGIISEVVLKQKMRCSSKGSDKPEMTPEKITEILFYDAPWNLIVAPTQEAKKSFKIRTK